MTQPFQYQTGQTWFSANHDFHWGDFTTTALDVDGLTFWTIQQFADARIDTSLGTASSTRILSVTPF